MLVLCTTAEGVFEVWDPVTLIVHSTDCFTKPLCVSGLFGEKRIFILAVSVD